LGSRELEQKTEQSPAPYVKAHLNAASIALFTQPGDVPIGLQTMTGKVSFRNIRIRRLDSTEH